MPQVGDGPPAGVGDGGQGLVEAVGRGGQVARRLGLHDHRRHVVGHDVVELAGDAGAFGGAGGLGDVAAAFGLGGPGGAQPRPDAPRERQRQVEHHEPVDALARAEPVERDRQRHVRRRRARTSGGAPVAFQMGRRAQQRDGQRGARERVVAAELVDGEAERHQGEADGRPPPAYGEREALQGDRHDGQRVEGAGRQVAELRPVAAEGRQQRQREQHQREREIPDRDRQSPPQIRNPPEIVHAESVTAAAGPAGRRGKNVRSHGSPFGTARPRRPPAITGGGGEAAPGRHVRRSRPAR